MKQPLHTRSLGIYGSRLGRFLMMLALMLPLLAVSPAQENAPKAHAALLEMAARQPNARVSVIVQKSVKDNTLEQMVKDMGGTVTHDLSMINAFAAEMSAQAAEKLSRSESVRWVSPDAPVKQAAGCSQCIKTDKIMDAYIKTIGADKVWNEAPYVQGQNVTVAVVDSGIAPHNDLKQHYGGGGNSRILESVVYSDNTTRWEDYYGHGTHVAGIIGGNGSQAKLKRIGVAPKVKLVNVKVGDDVGNARSSDVVAGLQWIYENRTRHNIKVVNMSLNSSVAESYLTSPLSAAVQILWFNKIVVVVSAGNNGVGINNGILYPPANDPFVITVGATNDKGTASLIDDTMAPYSAYGLTPDGIAKPDLVAPGTNIVSLLATTSGHIYQHHPDHQASGFDGAGDYYRMSGTSMAAAVTSGAVALLVQDEPNLTPDQVKYRLKATARPLVQLGTGAGYLDIYAAVRGTTTESANTGLQVSPLLQTGSTPIEWGSVNWGSVNWGSVNWGSVNWGSVNWGSVNWGSVNWDY